jgi:hypothetical protein
MTEGSPYEKFVYDLPMKLSLSGANHGQTMGQIIGKIFPMIFPGK